MYWMKTCLTVLCLILMVGFEVASGQTADDDSELTFSVELTTAKSGFDGETCWVHARGGAIPPHAEGNDRDVPHVVMTTQKLLLSGSDVFYRLHQTDSYDLGKSWDALEPIEPFTRETVQADAETPVTGGQIAPRLLQPGDETTVCDFVPKWHVGSQRLLGIGQTVWYRENRVMRVRPRGIAYAVFDVKKQRWTKWRTVELPKERRFEGAGSGSQQRVDLPGGDVLVPFYFKEPEKKQYSSAVCRCRFDGKTLHFVEHGNALTLAVKRGLYEPSLTRFRNRFYLTLRNDEGAYVSVSDDGLNYESPVSWTFDDGSELGSYNTQQHWVTHNDGLFLVYTRRGANNDHVFRHRAPLFIARVDPERLCVLRETERILVPERGARLGNFGVVDVSADETWVTVTEWMQPEGVEQYGSDNSIFVAKLKWNRPNRSAFPDANDIAHLKSGGDGRLDANSEGTLESALSRAYARPPGSLKDERGDYRSPLLFNDGTKVESSADWQRRRGEILEQWQSFLGKWPPLKTRPEVEILESVPRENFTQHKVRFAWTPGEKTTGYLLIPQGEGPFPAVVTVYYEPETAIGLGKPHRDFALQLARRGFVTLSIGTTEATNAKTYALYHPSIDDAKVAPLSMLGYAAANAWHVLADRPEVDSNRIGIVGHSFGGKWAMFASCLFDKFACAAWSDPGIVFDESRPSVNYWEPWYLGYHPKPWRKRGVITAGNPARGLYDDLVRGGHDLHELHALMAPRPFLVSGGSEDPIDRWQALNHSRDVNQVLGHDDRVWMTNRPDHSPNADSNALIYEFFQRHLGR